jgi:hypothetical protein
MIDPANLNPSWAYAPKPANQKPTVGLAKLSKIFYSFSLDFVVDANSRPRLCCTFSKLLVSVCWLILTAFNLYCPWQNCRAFLGAISVFVAIFLMLFKRNK